MVTVTGTLVRERILNPNQEAIAVNDYQRHLLVNATPEVDCLAEKIVLLRRHGVPEHVLRDLLTDVTSVYALNNEEGEFERQVAGTADQLARDAENAVRNQAAGAGSLTVRALARELRPLLRTIKQGHKADPVEYVRACRKVARIVDATATDRLTCTFMRTELGPRSFALLEEIATDRTEA